MLNDKNIKRPKSGKPPLLKPLTGITKKPLQNNNNQNKDKNKDQNKDKNKDKNKDQDKNKNENENKNNQNENKERPQDGQMSKENAEQLLNAAVQEEKATQQRLQKAMAQPRRRNIEKNW